MALYGSDYHLLSCFCFVLLKRLMKRCPKKGYGPLALFRIHSRFYLSPKGEEHFNCISALHKSMRGSDENASLYWLGRMLEGGEDPLYVARRMVRFASEDVGTSG